MKNLFLKSILSLFFIASLAAITGSCTKDSCARTVHYQVVTPVYKSFADVRSSFGSKPASEINNPGKIYIFGKYLFVNETGKGIHIIDNTNPASPQNISFINIPGNVDMAVRNNILFADCYVDLLAIDITDPRNVTLASRYEGFYKNLGNFDAQQGVIVDYKTEDKVQTYSECQQTPGVFYATNNVAYTKSGTGMVPVTASNTASNGSATGTGGSMAKFTVVGNYLYGVDNTSIYCVNVTNTAHLNVENTLATTGITESIFPYNGKLFIGGVSGMMIYSLNNPSKPTFESNFGHTTSCDPVVVNDKYAFITLHQGTPCHTHDGINELDVADISDIHNPTAIKTYAFTHPLGLGVDGSTLFICDDQDGLKVFDATDPMTITDHRLGTYPVNGAYDVIPNNNDLILTAKDGLYQYDYSDPKNLKLLSKLTVTRQQ
jgi:hypothetical protein